MTDQATDVQDPDHVRPAHRLQRLRQRLHANRVTSVTTRVVVAVVGGLVTAVGVVMIVTPGPAFVLIPLGLAILATEFHWARRWLDWAKAKAEEARRRSEQMDPAVRRRRLLVSGTVVLVTVSALVAYVAVYDWPGIAVEGWDWVQSLAGWLPELPGM